MLLAQKVKPQAMRKKEPVAKKERNVKYGSNTQNVNVARQQSKRSDPETQDYPVHTESTLFRFVRRNFGVELALDSSDDTKESSPRPSGRVSSSRRGNTKFLDYYGMDIAPRKIFENQCIPVGIHNFSKGVQSNLNTIRVFSRGTKFIPKWNTIKTGHTFKRFKEFKNQMNSKVFFRNQNQK